VSHTESWIRSRVCSNSGCVEVQFLRSEIRLRDSKSPDTGVISFTPEAWTRVLAALQAGKCLLKVDGVQFTPSTSGGLTVHAPATSPTPAVMLCFTEHEVTAFLTGVRTGEFDLPAAA
jgi:hypothetical protein